jgi:hypothetical protein
MLWVMSMLPCSTCFTCHHEFPAKLCLLPTHACPLHVVLMESWWKGIQWRMHD